MAFLMGSDSLRVFEYHYDSRKKNTFSLKDQVLFFNTVVGYYINTMKTTFFIKVLIAKKLISNYEFTSN